MSERKYQRVAVLMGGPSSERAVSLRSGAAVAGGLREAGYTVTDVDVLDRSVVLPTGIDAVFIALHGAFGEDGAVQTLLEEKGLPYTGSGPEASRIAFDKRLSKESFVAHGVPTPDYEILRAGEPRTYPLPVVIKPLREGSSIGVHRVFEEDEWEEAWNDTLRYGEEVLVERYIEGRELTVGIVGQQVLPVVEICPPEGGYDYEAKYTRGRTSYLVPAPIEEHLSRQCQDWALKAYQGLGSRGMGRVDFRMSPEGLLFVLENNSIPGFTETSLLPKAAAEAGIDFPALCSRIMESATI